MCESLITKIYSNAESNAARSIYPMIVYLPPWFFNIYKEEIPKDTKSLRYVPLPEKFEVRQSCSMEIKNSV